MINKWLKELAINRRVLPKEQIGFQTTYDLRQKLDQFCRERDIKTRALALDCAIYLLWETHSDESKLIKSQNQIERGGPKICFEAGHSPYDRRLFQCPQCKERLTNSA